MYQLVQSPKTYFQNVWNFIDSLPVVSAMLPVYFYLREMYLEKLEES